MESKIYTEFILKQDYEALKVTLKENELEREKKAEQTKQHFADFQANIEGEISLICQSVIKQKLIQYEKVAKQFQQFFNTEEIQSIVDRKADIELIEKLQQTKAQKTELAVTNSLIDQLHGRLKHMSILVAELAKASIPSKASSSFKGGEQLNTKIQRRDFLSKQAAIINQWITDTTLVDSLNGVTSGASKQQKLKQIDNLFISDDVPQAVLEFEQMFVQNQQRRNPSVISKFNKNTSLKVKSRESSPSHYDGDSLHQSLFTDQHSVLKSRQKTAKTKSMVNKQGAFGSIISNNPHKHSRESLSVLDNEDQISILNMQQQARNRSRQKTAITENSQI